MRQFIHRLAEAIRREPDAFRRIDQAGQSSDLSRGRQQDHLLDAGRTPRR
jgi:hypothetical protein